MHTGALFQKPLPRPSSLSHSFACLVLMSLRSVPKHCLCRLFLGRWDTVTPHCAVSSHPAVLAQEPGEEQAAKIRDEEPKTEGTQRKEFLQLLACPFPSPRTPCVGDSHVHSEPEGYSPSSGREAGGFLKASLKPDRTA